MVIDKPYFLYRREFGTGWEKTSECYASRDEAEAAMDQRQGISDAWTELKVEDERKNLVTKA